MQLHKKTQIEVQALLDKTGHALSLADIPDILDLNELANRITSTAGDYAEITAWPVKCGNLLLRPLTIGKMQWYNKRALVWFNDDLETLSTVLAFILSVENDEDFVWGLEDAQTARDTINEWEKTLNVTNTELAAAVALVTAQQTGTDDGQDNAQDFGPLVALLCREYGNTPRYWMYEESINVIRALMDDYTRRINAEIQHRNKQSGGKRKQAIAPIKTPSMEAGLKFRKKLIDLEAKWSVSNVG